MMISKNFTAATEVDVLDGAVVRLGGKQRIPTPANSLLLSVIKFLESR